MEKDACSWNFSLKREIEHGLMNMKFSYKNTAHTRYLISSTPFPKQVLFFSILKIKELRFSEETALTQCHRASKWWKWNKNISHSDSEVHILWTRPNCHSLLLSSRKCEVVEFLLSQDSWGVRSQSEKTLVLHFGLWMDRITLNKWIQRRWDCF